MIAPFRTAKAVFEEHLNHVVRDERDSQLALFAEDAVWRFPFPQAGLPSVLEGRTAIAEAMTPRWERARQMGLGRISAEPVSLHENSDGSAVLAEFDLLTARRRLRFVQFMRVNDGRIAELREYADTAAMAGLPHGER